MLRPMKVDEVLGLDLWGQEHAGAGLGRGSQGSCICGVSCVVAQQFANEQGPLRVGLLLEPFGRECFPNLLLLNEFQRQRVALVHGEILVILMQSVSRVASQDVS
eukprot:1747369-Rhodomonas_salina.2